MSTTSNRSRRPWSELETGEQQNSAQPTVPDLLSGIGRLKLRRGSTSSLVSDKESSEQSRRIVKAGSRLRALSLTREKTPKSCQSKTKKSILPGMDGNKASPARQQKITEVFLNQDQNKKENGRASVSLNYAAYNQDVLPKEETPQEGI